MDEECYFSSSVLLRLSWAVADEVTVPDATSCGKALHPIALAAIVVGWIALAAFGAVMTYAAWTEDGLEWYFAIGPTIGAVMVAGGALVGLPLIVREQLQLRKSNSR